MQLTSVVNSSLDINDVLESAMQFVEEMMNAEAREGLNLWFFGPGQRTWVPPFQRD